MLHWILGIIIVLALFFSGYADSLAGKKKHSNYYQKVKNNSGKPERMPKVPDTTQHDKFFSRINSFSA